MTLPLWLIQPSSTELKRCAHAGGLPQWLSGKDSDYQCRSQSRGYFDPWVGRIPWRRAWPPTPIFLPGKSRGQRSLVGCNPWGCKEWDTTEHACASMQGAGELGTVWACLGQTSGSPRLLSCCRPGCLPSSGATALAGKEGASAELRAGALSSYPLLCSVCLCRAGLVGGSRQRKGNE